MCANLPRIWRPSKIIVCVMQSETEKDSNTTMSASQTPQVSVCSRRSVPCCMNNETKGAPSLYGIAQSVTSWSKNVKVRKIHVLFISAAFDVTYRETGLFLLRWQTRWWCEADKRFTARLVCTEHKCLSTLSDTFNEANPVLITSLIAGNQCWSQGTISHTDVAQTLVVKRKGFLLLSIILFLLFPDSDLKKMMKLCSWTRDSL